MSPALVLWGVIFLQLAGFSLDVCMAIDNITITQPLRDFETIVSSGQRFKLGFFSPVNSSNRYVGIMFNTPEMTVIWVANRDKPLNDSTGIMAISEDGNLVVLNGKKEILWSSNVSNSVGNSTAQLLDTGNLVLRDNSNGRINIWESFQIPTDSLVRKMRLSVSTNDQKTQLNSWRSPSDPSMGSFSAGVDPRQIPQLFIWYENTPYWRSGPWNGNAFIGLPGMNSEYQNGFDLVDDNSGSPYFTFTYMNDSVLFYFVLSSTGSLQQKFSPDGKADWVVTWSSLESPCDVYGKCGPFGSCISHGSPICTCLRGFEPRDEEEWKRGNWSGGCTRRTLLQCDRNGSAGKQDGYLMLTHAKVPDFAQYSRTSENDCGNECLNNCSCIAYAYYTGVGCMHWSGNLIDVQKLSSYGADLYVRVAYSELDHGSHMKTVITSTVSAGILIIGISAYISWKWLAKHKGGARKLKSMLSEKVGEAKLKELHLYSYETLATATDNFHSANELGKGGFGSVYKGRLLNGQEIAVKRLSNSSSQGIEEFMNEVSVISKLQHRNLVTLLGCCVEREEKMLVYEYMPNKSLDAYLFDSWKPELLDWNRRAIIIEGIGRGLLYLHRDSRLKIIHRDLKASNILLDEELNPKISDFGLARIFRGNQDQGNTNRVVGTYGYMAPEYAMGGKFSEKSDIFSFGVLLLEILSWRRNTSFYDDENGPTLLGCAWKLWNRNEIVKLIDPRIYDPSIEMTVLRYVHIGLLCVQEYAVDRPNVSTLLSMLNSEIAELPPPKLSAYTGRFGSSENGCARQNVQSINDVTLSVLEGR